MERFFPFGARIGTVDRGHSKAGESLALQTLARDSDVLAEQTE